MVNEKRYFKAITSESLLYIFNEQIECLLRRTTINYYTLYIIPLCTFFCIYNIGIDLKKNNKQDSGE